MIQAWHATGERFEVFDTSRSDLGAHFGSLQQACTILSRRAAAWKSPQLLQVVLEVSRPIRLRDEGSFHADGIALQMARRGLLSLSQAREIRQICDRDWRMRRTYDAHLLQLVRAAGYDCVAYRNQHEGHGDSWIVFDSARIRIVRRWEGRDLMGLVANRLALAGVPSAAEGAGLVEQGSEQQGQGTVVDRERG